MFAAEKKVISFKSGASYSPDAKVSPFYIYGGEGMVRGEREMLVAVVKNFISAITFPIIIRWQMDSLCVSRGRAGGPPPPPPERVSSASASQLQEVSRVEPGGEGV